MTGVFSSSHSFLSLPPVVKWRIRSVHLTFNSFLAHFRLKWSFAAAAHMLDGCVWELPRWPTCLTPELKVLTPQGVMDRKCRRRELGKLACIHGGDIDEFARSKRRWFAQARQVFMVNGWSLADVQGRSREIVCLWCVLSIHQLLVLTLLSYT